MTVNLHFICKHGESFRKIGDQEFESGNWSCSDQTVQASIGGRFYLHEKQKSDAWHGGTIEAWRKSDEAGRKIFTCRVDGEFRIRCPGNWSQERAIVRK